MILKAFGVIILLSLLFPQTTYSSNKLSSSTKAQSLRKELGRAQSVFFNYHKDSMNLDRAIDILQGILEKDPDNIEALLLLSRVWLTYGYAKAPNKEEMIRVFGNGVEVAKRALELVPENPDAHFFYVANLSSLGAVEGILKSIFLLPTIKREIDTILELKPDHIYGLAMKGLLYYALPGFLGGDTYLAELYVKKAISLDPHLTTLKIYLARIYLKQGRYREAKDTLEEIINEKKPTFLADWYLNVKIAKDMIAEIDKKINSTAYSFRDRANLFQP
ncbi:hypothetical protein HRbin37_01441 [bacterium HR37]|nr:hypothetical protein HRbin37_01441 [bacterium HR37]